MDLLTDMDLSFEQPLPDEDLYPDRHLRSVVDARYCRRPGAKDNPDVCALPLPATMQKILDVSTVPLREYDYKAIQTQPVYLRKEGVLLLQQAYAPLGHIFEMAWAVDAALLSSYMAREVRSTVWLGNTGLAPDDVPSQVYSVRSGYMGRAQSFVVAGVSGCGKTVGMNIIKNLYPQAIHHVIGDYEYTQIPIIMVTALVGNMSELMVSIGSAIDDIIGIGPVWQKKAQTRNVGMAASVIKEAIRLLHIGLIVIDESQFLRFDGSNASLENLIGIAEDTGCALGFIGNKELISKMNRYPRFVGRTMLNQIEVGFSGETDRTLFMQAIHHLWQYQWTKKRTELTEEIVQELVRDSMYNIAILKALLMRIQFEALTRYPKEGITPQYIHDISERKFANIRALVLDDTTDSEHELICLLQKNSNDIADDAKKLALKARTSLIQQKAKEQEVWDNRKLQDVETMLKYFGINASQMKRALRRLLAKDANLPNMDCPFIVDAVRKLLETDGRDTRARSVHKKKELDVQGELLVKEAMKKEVQPYDAGCMQETVSG